MTDLKVSLPTLFYIYCIYAFYCCLVIFFGPDNRGEIFRGLRIPVVVFLYFLLPCASLLYLYRAFWGVHSGIFWTGVVLVVPVSFLMMLYFLCDPKWPVGKFLQPDKLPTTAVLVLLSLNLALSVTAGAASAVVFYTRPAAIDRSGKEQQYEQVTQGLASLQQNEAAHEEKLQGIKREATSNLVTTYGPILTVLVPLITALITFGTSMITLVTLRHK